MREHKTALAHGAAVDESRGVARDENENFGGVAETVIADGDPADDVFRNMIEEDQPQRHAAEQIEAQIALAGGRLGWGNAGHRICNRDGAAAARRQ
jgi:hypothetical protein